MIKVSACCSGFLPGIISSYPAFIQLDSVCSIFGASRYSTLLLFLNYLADERYNTVQSVCIGDNPHLFVTEKHVPILQKAQICHCGLCTRHVRPRQSEGCLLVLAGSPALPLGGLAHIHVQWWAVHRSEPGNSGESRSSFQAEDGAQRIAGLRVHVQLKVDDAGMVWEDVQVFWVALS